MNYASAKGMKREFASVVYVRNKSREYTGPFPKIKQVVYAGREEYVFIPERMGRTLSGETFVAQREVMRSRRKYKVIVHRA